MILHELAHSPFCIPVRRVLEAAGVPFTTVEVLNHDRASLLRLTGGACYQVPVIEHEGEIVFETAPDTQHVARWLDAAFARGRLFPARLEGLQSILVPHLENEVEGATFPLCDAHYVPSIADPVARGMVIRHKERRFGHGCVEAWQRDRGALWTAAVEKLRPFDSMAAHSPYLLGAEPVWADFLLWGILGNLTWRNWNPFPPLPDLGRWHARLATYRFD